MKNKKKYFEIGFIILIGILCSLYFYNQLIHIEIPIHSDDAGTAIDIRDMFERGTFRLSYWLAPFNWINGILYNMFGATEFFLQSFFVFKYFVCITLSLYLGLYNRKSFAWWLVPIFIFLGAMPGSFGTASIQPLKFHVWTIAVPLFCLTYMLIRGNDIQKLKWIDITIIGFVAVFGLVERDILIVVTCWIPFAIYWFIYFLQKGHIKRYLKQIIISSSLLLIAGKLVFEGIKYTGYGANKFSSIDVIFQNILTGITGLLSLFNINYEGSDILQFNTIFVFIRIIILIYIIWCIISILKDIYIKKIENVSLVDAILSISAVVCVVAYLFGGYREDAISIRYVAYLYYIFPIILCRKSFELIKKQSLEIKIKKINVNVLSIFFGVCILTFIDDVDFYREKNDMDEFTQELETIGGLDCGLGSFWTAGVISVLSDYSVSVQAGSWENGQVIPYLSEWDDYGNGNRCFNFFIEDPEKNFGISEENLISTYGKYEKKYDISGKRVYVYDYDIRTKPICIKYDNTAYIALDHNVSIENNQIALKQKNSILLNNLAIRVGKIRITVNGEGLKGKIDLTSNYDISIIKSKDGLGEIVYEIDIDQLYDDLVLEIFNNSNRKVLIDSIIVERIENNIKLPLDFKQEIEMKKGYYEFAMEGENIKNSTMNFEVDGNMIEAKRINNGRQRVVYGILIENDGKMRIEASFKGKVDSFYYQNEISTNFDAVNKSVFTKGHGISINEAGTTLYGPYVDLDEGMYVLNIYGMGLNEVDIWFQNNGGDTYDDVFLTNRSNQKYSYLIDVKDKADLFEVLISDVSKESVNIRYYTLEKIEQPIKEKWELFYSYDDKKISTTGYVDNNKKCIVIKENELCYGPYLKLPKGAYCLTVNGKNISNADVSITYNSGAETFSNVTKTIVSDETVKYEFLLEKQCDNIEFIIRNNTNSNIDISTYEINNYFDKETK